MSRYDPAKRMIYWRGAICLLPVCVFEGMYALGWVLRRIGERGSGSLVDWCYKSEAK